MSLTKSHNVGDRGSTAFCQWRVIAKLACSQIQTQELHPPQTEQKRLRKGARLLSGQKLSCSDSASFPHAPSPPPLPVPKVRGGTQNPG